MRPTLTLHRRRVQPWSDRTLGSATLATEAGVVWSGASLEPPWVDADGDGLRDRRVSCIPEGTYRAVPHGWGRDARWTRFDQVWRLQDVPNGDAILVHALNFPHQTQGCIGLGERFGDLDGDGRADLVSSRPAINTLREHVGYRHLWVVVASEPDALVRLGQRLARTGVDPYPLIRLRAP